MSDRNIFERACETQRLEDFLRSIGFTVTYNRGQQWRGTCPFHGSHAGSDSLAVHVGKQRFYCHKCFRNGSLVNAYAEWHKLSLFKAAKELLYGTK